MHLDYSLAVSSELEVIFTTNIPYDTVGMSSPFSPSVGMMFLGGDEVPFSFLIRELPWFVEDFCHRWKITKSSLLSSSESSTRSISLIRSSNEWFRGLSSVTTSAFGVLREDKILSISLLFFFRAGLVLSPSYIFKNRAGTEGFEVIGWGPPQTMEQNFGPSPIFRRSLGVGMIGIDSWMPVSC